MERRHFLGLLGMGAAGAAVTPFLGKPKAIAAQEIQYVPVIEHFGNLPGLGGLRQQAREMNALQVLTITPQGEFSLVQISNELFEDLGSSDAVGGLWLRHLRRSLDSLRNSKRPRKR